MSAFHPNFQSALTDHGAYNSESTTTPKGWATPFVPSLLGTSIVLIIGFVLWELHREAKGESVLLPMSMWTQPGAKMGSTILLVFFGWWAFNTLGYYLPLFYQEVQLYSPIQTAVHLIPSGIAVSVSNSERVSLLMRSLGHHHKCHHWIFSITRPGSATGIGWDLHHIST